MQLQVFAVGAEIDVLRFIIRKSVPFQLRCGAVMNWLGTDKEINAVLLQYAVSQWEIIGGVRCRSLEGNHVCVAMITSPFLVSLVSFYKPPAGGNYRVLTAASIWWRARSSTLRGQAALSRM